MRCGRIVLTELKGATVSVFPFDGSSCNLTYEGLQYPLEKKTLSAGSSLMGVSNCITLRPRGNSREHRLGALVIVSHAEATAAGKNRRKAKIQSRSPETEDKERYRKNDTVTK